MVHQITWSILHSTTENSLLIENNERVHIHQYIISVTPVISMKKEQELKQSYSHWDMNEFYEVCNKAHDSKANCNCS